MKELIINADDMGMAPGINYGIIKAHREGIVTDVSLMVCMPYTEDAVRLLKKEAPNLSVGVHLCLTSQGNAKPVLPKKEVPSLVDKDGFFPRRPPIKKIWGFIPYMEFPNFKIEEVEKELAAQVQKALDLGIDITHLDSNEGFHNLNFEYLKIVIKLAKKLNVPIRWPNPFKLYLLKKEGILTTKYLHYTYYGVPKENKEDYFINFLKKLKNGVTEFITHPAIQDEVLAKLSPSGPAREKELEVMCKKEIKELIKKLNIKLVSFKELREKQRWKK
jgi:predicted glycoside hydrolase/deacetylase ChbG (UPF0249 family)